MKEINHYGICGTDGMIDGQFVTRGTVISVKKIVRDDEAADWLKNDKKLIHHAFDHRRSLLNCREGLCGDIQREIDGLELHESRVTDHESQ